MREGVIPFSRMGLVTHLIPFPIVYHQIPTTMSTKKETKLRDPKNVDFDVLRNKIEAMRSMTASCVSTLRDDVIPVGQRVINAKNVLFEVEKFGFEALHMIRE